MKTKSGDKVDCVAFEKMKRIAPNFLRTQRDLRLDAHQVRALPEEVAFKLTNRCNLRCKHCYQWNEEGHHHDLSEEEQKQDIDFALIEKVFAATRELQSNVYLWGGEPLIYRDWDKLVDLLERDPRWTSMCTNGLGLEKKLDSILRISQRLELLFAIEGFREEHDAIRGKGIFDRVMESIDLLLDARAAGEYKGEIAVNFVITDAMVPRVYELLEYFEAKGIDTLYLSFLWYISNETAKKMDAYYTHQFNPFWVVNNAHRQSWHAYSYRLDPDAVDRLIAELARVEERVWKIKLRYNPALNRDEIHDFILGSDKPAQGKTRCLSIKTRMDIFPNGEVISCKFFPEFSVGNLTTDSVDAVWHGERFSRVREVVDNGLMPVCAKCNLLYSRGI